MNKDTTFGVRLRAIRAHRGFSQETLANNANKSVDTISNLERGISLPGYEMIIALASALAVPVSDFFPTEKEDPERAALIATIMTVVRQLPDDDLKIAVEQVISLSRR